MTPARRTACMTGILGAALAASGAPGYAAAHDTRRAVASPAEARANQVHDLYPEPSSPLDAPESEADATDTLAAAIAQAYATNPALAARRYDLRATDGDLGLALSQLRPSVQLKVSSGYGVTWPGDITQASRPLADRLNDPRVERNDLSGQLLIEQPLTSGGRVSAEIAAARAEIRSGRETLRGSEGDLLLDVIAAYCDVRRDTAALGIRRRNEALLLATLDEVVARREAGELTRTDIAQAQAQLHAARVQRNAAEAQLEQSRAAFAALVGRPPGLLAEAPDLPAVPTAIDDLFEIAERGNPELAAAIEAEQASRARIAAARGEGRPFLSLRGTLDTTGPVSPFDRRDHDLTAAGRLTLTIHLSAGGRVRALEDQALNRNSADRLRIEATRRQLVQNLITAWNQMMTAQRNETVQIEQARTARIFYEGTTQEYREGLRSTFDVLYAQNAVHDAQIALLATRRDRFVASAVLLRQLGQLEANQLTSGVDRYDPALHTARVERRSGLPWDGAIRMVDRLVMPGSKPQPVETPAYATGEAQMAPGRPVPDDLPLIAVEPESAAGKMGAIPPEVRP